MLDEQPIADLRKVCRGEVIGTADQGYEQARRVWNAMIDRRPAAIVKCTGVADVLQAVDFAHEHELPVAIRAGGHSAAGKSVCDDGLVIDLSPMKGIRVDPARQTAHAQAGLTWGEFDRETQVFGLATTGGLVSTTGIAGLTLGGGVGWLMGKHGLTCDNLVSADLVTADGRVVMASADENEDLFWGLRGGGGNFGIVTSFQYQLHPVGQVLGGMVLHPVSRAKEVLHFYREYTASAPDELTAYAGAFTAPDIGPVVGVALCYAGRLEEGERLVEPLRRFGPPIADLVRPMRYVELQSMLDAGAPHGLHSYWKANQLTGLTDEAVEVFVAHASQLSSPLTWVLLEHHHGAVCRVAPGAAAFPHREAPYDLVLLSLWNDPSESERHIRWTREFFEAMRPYFAGGVYVNSLGEDDGTERVKAAYGENYGRLVALKRKWDPENFFRLNQNIKP